MITTNSEYKTKKRITAGLLGIFLGLFGVHNFYLKHVKKAIIQLCLSLSCPILFYLAIFLGLGLAHSTANIALALFAQLLFFISIFMTSIAFVWWLTDIIRIFMKKVKDSHGQLLR